MEKFIFTIPAKPFMGKIKCAFRDSWENFFPTFVASPLRGENPIPISPHQGNQPFPGSELKLISKITLGEIPDITSKNVKIRKILTNTQGNSFPGSCQDLGKKFPWVLARPSILFLGLAQT